MCEILKQHYVFAYSIPREETELHAAENQADEHSLSLNDMDFTENDLYIANKVLQTEYRWNSCSILQ